MIDGKVGGLAVNIGARIAALAGPSEVLVSSTVKDLIVGSGIDFAERGAHELKGVPGKWRVHLVTGAGGGL
jgi:class 3 adenylate cyclase